jgi:hypothetical protein
VSLQYRYSAFTVSCPWCSRISSFFGLISYLTDGIFCLLNNYCLFRLMAYLIEITTSLRYEDQVWLYAFLMEKCHSSSWNIWVVSFHVASCGNGETAKELLRLCTDSSDCNIHISCAGYVKFLWH